MRCLVTGGAGFIGSHLAATLVRRGLDVAVLDDFSSGHRANLAGLDLRVIEGDIRDEKCLSEAVRGVDIVFHQAALCSVARSMIDPVTTHEVNATGTLKLLEACRQAGVRRLVMASSSSVYGESETLPKHEGMHPEPLSPYAVSKLIGEHYCRLYWNAYGLETVILRYFNVFGPRQDPASEYAAVIPRFLDAILNGSPVCIYGDGTQTRDFTYVDNVVQANYAAAITPTAAGQVLNVACGDRWSLLELINHLEEILHCRVDPEFHEARPGDVRHSQASIDRARRFLGYSPTIGFAEGMNYTVDWFLECMRPARRLTASA